MIRRTFHLSRCARASALPYTRLLSSDKTQQTLHALEKALCEHGSKIETINSRHKYHQATIEKQMAYLNTRLANIEKQVSSIPPVLITNQLKSFRLADAKINIETITSVWSAVWNFAQKHKTIILYVILAIIAYKFASYLIWAAILYVLAIIGLSG